MSASCSNCRFALSAKQSGSTDLAALKANAVMCRRFPPTAHPIEMKGQLGQIPVRPMMQAGDWCGEHQPMPT